MKDGVKLYNDLTTPFYVKQVEQLEAGGLTKIVLKDANGILISLFWDEREHRKNRKVAEKLFVGGAPGTERAVAIGATTRDERYLGFMLESGSEHFVPGWTDDFSIENDRKIKAILLKIQRRNP